MSGNPNKDLWEKGDFTKIAAYMRESGESIGKEFGREGLKVADVGCGDGTTAVPLAQNGAIVTGIDIASNLVEAGNKRAAELGMENSLKFQVGDASKMPEVPNESFDLVITHFGAMFAPRPYDVAAELVRICKKGGHIVMGNWIAGDPTFVSQLLKISGKYSPPPPEGFVSPVTWGVEKEVLERFGKAGITIENVSFSHQIYNFTGPTSPKEFMDVMRDFYGPTMNAFNAATVNGKRDDLQKEIYELGETQNTSTSISGTTCIPAKYLRVIVNV